MKTHGIAPSGLWSHSHDPANDLMKQYVVERKTPAGWLAIASYDTAARAVLSLPRSVVPGGDWRIWDNFADEVWL